MSRPSRPRPAWLGPAFVPRVGSAYLSPGEALLALCLVGLGVRGLVYGDFAGVWQRIPIAHLPANDSFALITAIIALLVGFGLLVRRSAPTASIVLTTFLLLWAVSLKVPGVVAMPEMEATWLGLAEITVILAGGWTSMTLHRAKPTRRTTAGGVYAARLLFGLSLMPIGLAHLVYPVQTMELMPAWLPWHLGLVYLTGAASLMAAIAVMLGLLPRLATMLEATMLSFITLVIWLPGLIDAAGNETWTPFLMSSAIACGAWAVADGYRLSPRLGGAR